jgi:tetratricopeptide (TPR) repeat protein
MADQQGATSLAQEALALAQQRRYTEAIPLFTTAVERSPRDLELRMWLAYCYEESHRFQEALEHYQSALTLAPGDPELKAAAARMHAALRERPTAEDRGLPVTADGRRMHGWTSPGLIAAVLVLLGLAAVVLVVALVRPGHKPPQLPPGVEPGFRPGLKLPVPTTAGRTVDIGRTKREAREAQLLAALGTLRQEIEAYRQTRGRYPDRLQDLVEASPPPEGGSEAGPALTPTNPEAILPPDPFTGNADTWVYDSDTGEVHSSSGMKGLNGVPYSEW